MTCPYCGEPVNDGATVCKTCQRDITLVLSLKDANQAFEQRIKELEAEIAALGERVPPEEAAPAAKLAPAPPNLLDILAFNLALPTILLIGTHYLLVIRFDINLVWLRAASIALPTFFGLMLDRKTQPLWFISLAFGFAVALASVFGMSIMVHLTDGDPILPHSGIAWRETLEYITSISLAYLLGAWIARTLRPLGPRGRRGAGHVVNLATFLAVNLSGKTKGKALTEQVERLVKLINLAISATTAFGAVYAGFKSIL